MNNKSAFYCEHELVLLLKQNNKASFEYLYDHYSPALYAITCKIVKDENKASDILQDSFIKIWKSIGSYDEGKGTLFTWMLNITRRTAIDKLRSDLKFQRSIEWTTIQEDELSFGTIIIPSPATLDVRSLVGRLLPERKKLIELVYFEGYTQQEASEHLQLPLGTVKSRIRKALAELRRVF